jgi:hypothetical protein
MLRIFLILWELPQFLLSFIILIAVKRKITDTIKYKNTLVFFVKGFPGGISLSFLIFLDDREKSNPKSIKHEYGHTRQSKILGWLYLPIVGLPSIIRASIWNRYRLDPEKYYKGFPENWADSLGDL